MGEMNSPGTGDNNPLSWRANISSSTRLMWSPDMSFVGMPPGQTVGRRTKYIHLK